MKNLNHRVYKVKEILNELEYCIQNDLPFSHIRFGDGGVKFIHAVLNNDIIQLKVICKKEGIPLSEVVNVCKLWGYYARKANFIDTPEVYFSGEFWDRLRRPGKSMTRDTYEKMHMWKELYDSVEIDNYRYCNPESNYLMILDLGERNLLDVMKERKICIITAKPSIQFTLQDDYDITLVPIVGQYEDQYQNSFEKTINIIKNSSREYDLWLVAAGELGRIYSGEIKECGGRCVDIGFVIEYWLGAPIHPRLKLFMTPDKSNKFQLVLTKKWGETYRDFI